MRLTAIIIFLLVFLVSYSQDSLKNAHYKVNFSILGKCNSSQFEYKNSIDGISQYKTYSEGYYSLYAGHVRTSYTFNPEIKIDFELPLWLKLSCGFNYTAIKFSTNSDRIFYSKYNIYDPHSTPTNPIVVGFNTTSNVVGYNKDEFEISGFGTFFGAGLSKQYKRFNFDIDYCFSSTKIMNAFTVRKIYDSNNNLEKTEAYNFMDNYIHQFGLLIFSHNFSTSVSYRLYKNIRFKLGLQYSKNDNDIKDDTYQHYSTFKEVRHKSVFAGFAFSVL